MVWSRIKKILIICCWFILVFYGLWFVIANQLPISVNLLFVEVGALNSGFALVASFVGGAIFGVLASLFIWGVIPLRWQLRQTNKELTALRKQTVRPPVEP